ncbi:hypothetical protein EDD11_001515 [Mortierella claussenii]|nr:hypothetical protein EDD11_001515 [Mortierella claussenii]
MHAVLSGQIVHARKCYRRLFFIDLRLDSTSKCTILFRADDPRPPQVDIERLTDQDLISRWKRIRRGDIVQLSVFDASADEIAKRDHPVYQATDFAVLKAWPGDHPFPSEPAMGLKQSPFVSTLASSIPSEAGATVPLSSPISAISASINTSLTGLSSPLTAATATENISTELEMASWEDYCKFWINSQKCFKKDCYKRHPTGVEYTRVQEMWVKERTHARKQRSTLKDDPHALSSKVPHSQRAYIFCKWLVGQFGKEFLNSGSGVLDIAGGKGEISLFLTHMFGIRSTVVEPNERRDKPYQRRNLMDVIQKQLDIEAGGDGQFYKRAGTLSDTLKPQGQRADVLPATGESAALVDVDLDAMKKEQRRLRKLQREQFIVPRLCTLLDGRFLAEHPEVFEGASILIGMHPDQATEPIVDMALMHNKPFAVVPCCVFAHENPQRRLSDGGEVSTTLDFIQYLVEKDTGRIGKEFLAFDGMNIVVYHQPQEAKPQ